MIEAQQVVSPLAAMKQWAEDVSKVYDVLAFGHSERALELLSKTRTSLRQAIAEAEKQEPVAIVTSEAGNPDVRMSWWHEPALPVGTKLYTTPPQPEQEPVVWMYQDKSTHEVKFQKHMRGFVDHGATYETPLYTTPPQRKPLSLHELSKIFASIPSIPFDGDWQLELVRAIEAAHGIKENT